MPVEISCSHCSKRLRVRDHLVGKQVKCPQCQNAFLAQPVDGAAAAPASSASSEADSASSDGAGRRVVAPSKSALAASGWHVQTEDGQQYGPISKTELDSWVTENRLTAECQVYQDGWPEWRWASEIYPALAAQQQPEPQPQPQGFNIVPDADPYRSPASSSFGIAPRGVDSGSGMSIGIRRAMSGTSPWVLFLSILGFIVIGLTALGMLLNLGLAFATGSGTVIGAVFLSILIQAIVVGVYYGLPTFALFSYYRAIGAFLRNQDERSLERALHAQKRFWMIVGILAIVTIALMLILFLLVFAAGMSILSGLSRLGA